MQELTPIENPTSILISNISNLGLSEINNENSVVQFNTLDDLRNNYSVKSKVVVVLGNKEKNDGFHGFYVLLEDDNITYPTENFIIKDKINQRWIYIHPIEEDPLLDNILLNEDFASIIFPETFGNIEKDKDCSDILNKTFEYAAFVNNSIVYLNKEYLVEKDICVPKSSLKIVGPLVDDNNLNFDMSIFLDNTKMSSYNYLNELNIFHNLKNNIVFKNNSKIILDTDKENQIAFLGLYIKKHNYSLDHVKTESKAPSLFAGNYEYTHLINFLALGYSI